MLLHCAPPPPKSATTDSSVLAVQLLVLAGDDSRDIPISFRLAMEGTVTLTITWPESLQRKELATGATIHVQFAYWI